jgi:peptide methionine sulfoxide reductase MsrB
MAWYKNANNLQQAEGTEAVWSTDYQPGATVPTSGIYRCKNCGKEVTCNDGDPFPPQNHPLAINHLDEHFW